MKLLSSASYGNFTNGSLLQINYFIVFYCCSVREVSREPCTNSSTLGDQQEEEKGGAFSISRFSPSPCLPPPLLFAPATQSLKLKHPNPAYHFQLNCP